ncbi:cysteine protease ATG4B [Anopheles aquasalis]|uniref:cysteine protease ATG4B n=1 Tax=Anopheles aquasalis TaxID=42839 RepID=UPI00215AC4EB|nr:cysteine protease ATG4B [Anopheles aquasalis]XP_050084529.1 cysteine protease ATG4B [Anopheles aquasalis]
MDMLDAYVGYDLGSGSEPDDIPRTDETVWILGKQYHATDDIEAIRQDVQSRLWCTYRRGFVPIGNTQLTTDKGWGCMLRCGQMVLAEALTELHLGRDWQWSEETRDATYLKIVNRFEDNKQAPFSLHQIALMGDSSEEKRIGEWFGPNTVAQVLKKLVKFDDWCRLVIHVALDNTLATDEIVELCTEQKPGSDPRWQPLLLIIPLRLGLSEVNPIYIEGLKKCFQLPGSCGMIGGRPNQALYFIGYVGEEALYLDPHTVQRVGCIGEKLEPAEQEQDVTFHQRHASRIAFASMDPSLAVCFLCCSRAQFDQLVAHFNERLNGGGSQPLFEVTKTRQAPWTPTTVSSASSRKNSEPNEAFNVISATEIPNEEFEELEPRPLDDSDEEFEIIA